MKKYYVFLFLVFLSLSVRAEWILQTNAPPADLEIPSNPSWQVDLSTGSVSGGPPANTSPNAMASMSVAGGDDIIGDFARQLEYDESLIIEYVHNRIRTEPYTGLLRSPERTLFDGAGSPMEQLQLALELLRRIPGGDDFVAAKTYSIATPLQSSTAVDVCDLTGLDDPIAAVNLLNRGKMVISANAQEAVLFRVFLIKFNLNTGSVVAAYELSHKRHSPAVLPDIAAASSLTRDGLLSAAGTGGGTVNTVGQLSVSGVEGLLSIYTTNLIQSIRSGGAAAYPESLVPEVVEATPEAVPAVSAALGWDTWDLETNYNGHLLLTGGNLPTSGVEFNTYETSHRKISIRSLESGSNYKMQVWLDDTLLATEGTGGAAGSAFELTGDFIFAGETISNTYALERGGTYVFCQSFGTGPSSSMGTHFSANADRLRHEGADEEEVLTESLAYTGQRWMEQMGGSTDLVRHLTGQRHVMKYQFGIMAADPEGFHIDIKHQLKYSSGDLSEFGFMDMFTGSALEHAVLEQTQPGNALGISTIRIIKEANQSNKTVYRLHSGNWNTYKGQLSGYDNAELEARINDGQTLVLPETAVTIGAWTGEGYAAHKSDKLSMKIGGGYDGGYNGWKIPYNPPVQRKVTVPSVIPPVKTWSPPKSIDPVDMLTGAFLYENADLTLDGGWPLELQRHYRSDAVASEATMGPGWTHSFDIYASEHTAFNAAYGGRGAEDMAALLVGSAAIQELLEGETTPREWVVAAFAADWIAEQLTQNAVSIHLGGRSLTFIRQPDGSFSPPPGMTVSLEESAVSGESYIMRERHGNTYVFDDNLKLDRIEDPYANSLSFAYNAQTNLQTVTSSFGQQLTFTHESGLLTKVKDNAGREVSYEYGSSGNLTNHVDTEGLDWGIAYSDTNHPYAVTSLTDPEDTVTVQNTYNSAGQVIGQISASGKPYTLHVSGYQSTEIDPLGGRSTHRYDTRGRTVETVAADHATSRTAYDEFDRVVQTVSPNMVTNTFVYDVDHNLLVQTNAAGLPEQVVTAFGYDDGHHLRFMTNALGTAEQTVTETTYTAEHKPDTITVAQGSLLATVTDFDYTTEGLLERMREGNGARITTYSNFDARGNARTVHSTDAGTVERSFNARGDLLTETVDGVTSAYGYDDRRLPVAATNAFGTADQIVTSSTYWKNGLPKTTTDARDKTTRHYWTVAYREAGTVFPNTGSTTNLYDDADRLVMSRDAEGNWATNVLDSVGRPVSVSSVYSVVTNQFDISGNLTNSVVDPGGLDLWAASSFDNLGRQVLAKTSLSETEVHYDYLDRVTNSVNAADREWNTQFDELGRVQKSFRPSGAFEEVGYDSLGNRTVFWNAERKPAHFGIDAQGRVTSITNAIGKVTSFGYTDSGNLEWKRSPDTKLTQYGYDSLNRLVAVTNDGIEVATFNHDPNGNILNHEDSKGTKVEFGYDAMNRLIASTQSVSSVQSVVQNQYDLNGNRTNIVYPGGLEVGYVYGADNRLESVTAKYTQLGAGATNWTKTISFGYDTANRLTGISRPNGANTTLGLDAEGRITSIVHGSFVNRQIIRNELGFKETELIDAGLKPAAPETARRIKTHNDADQLVSESVQTAVTNWADVTYSYSANGCLTNAASTAQSLRRYFFDYADRLTAAAKGIEATYHQYDAAGSRVKRTEHFMAVDPDDDIPQVLPVVSYYVVDHADSLKRPLAELDENGDPTRYYVWSGSLLLAHIDADGTTRYYHADELGSTLALTDETGNVAAEFAYMPYGHVHHEAYASDSETPFQWLGGYGVYYDYKTELHLTLHRAYSAKMKRFVQSDPLGIDGGANVYAMANRNPLAFIDPYGLEAMSPSLGSSPNSLSSRWNSGIARFKQQFKKKTPTVVNTAKYAPDIHHDGRLGYVAKTKGMAAAAVLAISDFTGASAINEALTGRSLATGQMLSASEHRAAYRSAFTTVAAYSLAAVKVAPKTTKLLPGPKIQARWGVNNYRHGGRMSAIEHINYRHNYNSGFQNVSRFSNGTSVRSISSYVDDALRKGAVTPSGSNGFMIEHNLGRTIGTTPAGDAASGIRVFVRDGNIQTAFPVGL